MASFFEQGLFHDYNVRVLNPRGLHATFYLQDFDGQVKVEGVSQPDGQCVLGWHVLPLVEARSLGVVPSPAQAAARVEAFRTFIEQEQTS